MTINKEGERKKKLIRNEIGDYFIRPSNVIQNLELICETLGISTQKEWYKYYDSPYAEVLLDNFSLYELKSSAAPLCDFSKHTNTQGRSLVTHFPINRPINLVAGNSLVAELGANIDLDTVITTWTFWEFADENKVSLFGIAQPETYWKMGKEEYPVRCGLEIYEREKMTEGQIEALKNTPLYGISLHIKSPKLEDKK